MRALLDLQSDCPETNLLRLTPKWCREPAGDASKRDGFLLYLMLGVANGTVFSETLDEVGVRVRPWCLHDCPKDYRFQPFQLRAELSQRTCRISQLETVERGPDPLFYAGCLVILFLNISAAIDLPPLVGQVCHHIIFVRQQGG